MDGTSGMTGEGHVRNRGAARGEIPRADSAVVLQEKTPNHLPPLRAKAVVVSSEGKRLGSISGQVTPRKRNDSEPPLLMSKRTRRYQNRGLLEDCGKSSDGT